MTPNTSTRNTSTLEWFKSSYSGNDGPDCVEVAIAPTTVHIRDSKNKHGARLAVADAAWTKFVAFTATR
ncbi:DUF397 domain-containing protein [Streptomyces lasiicapitis]|uniref:DUF397 domain-containing protein n=1 Tax=Streptomyces lasiicapitis TaxID=1923961 RepID=A0ABQ2M6E8_9ACTN|nr:DUF397 domain-containing protein [Streptomyces lasiicapitis]GGO47437.1 hypothetical protein GCM10012286_40730 [Streptomyces lasiicapitis]